MGGVIFVFIFGLIIGSFLNVVIARFDDWQSIMRGRSHCPKCKKSLSWFDLIPLLSYVVLRGRCRHCQQPISAQYPIVEFSTAALVAAGYYLVFVIADLAGWQGVAAFIAYIVTISALVTIFFHDLYEMLVPEVMSYVALIGATVFSLFYHQDPLVTLYGGLAALIPIALLVYPTRGIWMGEGDVKIAAALGLLVGWPSAVVFLVGSFIIGGIFGAYLLLRGQVKLKSAVPFAPFLIIAGLLALYWGPQLVEWYLGMLGYGY
ncbi:MAG: prepilin peptidase [Candidatus Berkelbacteria bacterium]|nr:MAG: prepilin peptidase [Candidatus Berkelbacteria bacterium]QQG51463.1 MAG: prepilin peptidase [Candidatus Berkelbacteria bacterium]